MFSFSTHPAALTIGGGLESAFEYLQRTWQKWLPVAAVAALVTFVIYLVAHPVDPSAWTTTDAFGQTRITANAATMAGYYMVTLVSGLTSLVAGWAFYATAICGLRNRPLEIEWAILRGVFVLVASILVGIVFAVAALIVFILIVVVAAAFSIIFLPIGILLAAGLATIAIVAAIYVGIRVIFVPIAVFDGFNPIDAIQESWRLSKGSVLRMLGWSLMAGLVGLGFGVLAVMGSLPFTVAGLTPASKAVSTLISLVGTCLVAYLLSVLYESERARKYPNIYGFAPVSGYPPFAGQGQYPGAPGGYPGQYPGAPTGPAPTPGWGTPPAPGLGTPPAHDWSSPPPYANARPIWGSNLQPQTPPPAQYATQVQAPPPPEPPTNS
jgi:hypothetical protein